MKDPGMESFFACSPHAVAALGSGGTVLGVNPAFTDLFGYTPEESEGANLDDLIAFGPEHGEACTLTRRMENGESFDFRAIRRRKGGAPVHVRCLGIRSAPGEGPVVDYAIYEDLDCARLEEDTPSDDAACLEALFSGSPYAVAFVGSRGIVRQVNGEFEKLFGYVSGEAVGQSLDDLVVPESCREEAERLTRRGDDGGKYRVETERRRKDGTILPVLVYNVKTRTGKGEVRDFVIYLDMSETREKERVQREAAERMKRIFQAIPDAVFILDTPEGKILDMNAEAESLSGYSLGEVLSKTFTELGAWLDPAQRERFHGMMRGMGSARDFQASFRRKDGALAHCLVSGESIELDGKNRIIGIAKDITERVRYEEAIRREKAYFENLFHHSPEAVVLADGESRIRRVNRAFLELFGLDPEDASPGVAVDDLIASRDRHEEASGITREVFMGNLVRKETVRYRKDGTPVDVFLQGLSFPLEGEGRAVYGIYQDIRDRKATERELRENVESMRRLWIDTVHVLSSTVEFLDPYTSEHQKAVSRIASGIAGKMGLGQEIQEVLVLAGLVHDIGKLGIPAEILNKPCQLSLMENRLVQMHSEVGYDILKKIRLPWPLADIVHQHHERLDGTGYPRGLAGDDILLEARIIAVADVFEAMQSHRPHRAALTLEQACEELRRGSGTKYDPDAVRACLELAG
jgi:PAS domain S-box-containing protein/putative nucleotidyltransferase with HDIG domain